MDNIENVPNGSPSATPVFSYLWFSMASQAFTFQERASDRDCDIHLRVFRGLRRPQKFLEGTYSSCFQMPPVSSLLLDLLLRFQRALLEVAPVVNGALIPDMALDIATAVEIARVCGEHWVLSYSTDDVRHIVRCKDGLLERKLDGVWEICSTSRFCSVLDFIEGVIQQVMRDIDLRYGLNWRNNIRFTRRDEPPERVDARYDAIAGYLTRHPKAPLLEEDTETVDEGETNTTAEIWV